MVKYNLIESEAWIEFTWSLITRAHFGLNILAHTQYVASSEYKSVFLYKMRAIEKDLYCSTV